MIWGLVLSCFFCNRGARDDVWIETGWWETGWRGDDSGSDCAPWISVRDADDKAVDELDFGTVSGSETVWLELAITNKGECDLILQALSLDGESFEMGEIEELLIAPEGSVPLTVGFSPVGSGAQTGTLLIVSNDPFDTEYVIDLLGALANGDMSTQTESVDLGEVAVGCDAEQLVMIGNTGPGPITIDSVTSDNEVFEIASDTLPAALEPEDEFTLLIRYSPTTEGESSGLVQVLSSDAGNAVIELPVTGTSVYSGWVDEAFQGTGSQRVFILDSIAVADTVVVRVSGVLAAGWNFDGSANAVVFDTDNAPSEGAEIIMTYAAQPVCD